MISGRARSPLLPVALGTTLVLVTYVTPIVSAPVTSNALGAGPAARAWILSSMSVGLAGALLAAGVLGDALGRRRVYDAGLGLLALGAGICAAAGSPAVAIAGRVVEGVGGAAVLACGLALLAGHFDPGPPRVHATAVWGASVGLGIALGSVAAAAIGEVGTGWRETYEATVVAALGLLLLSGRLADTRAEQPRRVDASGLVLLGIGLTLLVSAVTEVRNGVDVTSTGLALGAVLVLVCFGIVEFRVPQPLIEPALLRHPSFVAATLGSLTLGLSMIGVASFVPTMVQVGLGRGAWTASLIAATWAVVSVVTSLLVRRLPRPVAGPRDIAAVLVLVAAGQATGLGLTTDSGAWRLAVMMGLAGLGTGVLNAVLGRESVASVPPDRSAMGSGANNTARYLGAAVGITVFVTVATHTGDSLAAGWNHALLVAIALSLAGAAAIAYAGSRAQA